MNIAIEAIDALDYTKDGDTPVEKVFEFAKMLGEKRNDQQHHGLSVARRHYGG